MDLSTLDPELAEALVGVPPYELTSSTLAAQRLAFAPLGAPLSDEVTRTDLRIDPYGPIVRVHRPANTTGPLPCLLWMHGGGLVLGDRFQDDLRFDAWCRRHQTVAVSIEYRLAPEHPYPAAIDDCVSAFAWLTANSADLGIDPRRIGVGGASAGGGLAAALSQVLRDRDLALPSFQLLIYPMLDDRRRTASSQAELPMWPPAANAFGWRSYLGDLVGTAEVHSHASPARAVDFRSLPRAYVVVGGLDPFLDEVVDYATRLMHADVPTDLRVHTGLPHGFDALAPRAGAIRRANADLNEWLGRALLQRPRSS